MWNYELTLTNYKLQKIYHSLQLDKSRRFQSTSRAICIPPCTIKLNCFINFYSSNFKLLKG